MHLFKRYFSTTIDLLLAQRAQERLGRFILRRARGEDNDDSVSNGEYALLRRLAGSKQRSSVIFDVGANKGEWTNEACACFGNSAEFFAFEPVSATYAHLAAQVVLGSGQYKVKAMHLALGDNDGTAEIQISGSLAGSNSFYKREGGRVKSEHTESVRVAKGDTFCLEHRIQRINLLKIDTEGHEMAVLLGFNELLAHQAIDRVQFEYGGTWIDARRYLKDAFTFFSSHGYRLGRLMPDRVEWFSIYRQDMETFAYSNWVAALPGVRC